MSTEGGTPERIVDSNCTSALWSPDGNQLVLTCWREKAGGVIAWYLKLYDSRTRQLTELPDAEGMVGGTWVTQTTIVASNQGSTEFSILDLRTQKWHHLVSGHFVNWAVTRDGKYLVFTTSGMEPKLQRLRFADRQIETLTSLKGLRRVVDPVEKQTQVTVDADGSPILARDIGTQEIYALTVTWP
jgi:dipeptidyl aminopeptidase/acylaminoacyl peptidase